MEISGDFFAYLINIFMDFDGGTVKGLIENFRVLIVEIETTVTKLNFSQTKGTNSEIFPKTIPSQGHSCQLNKLLHTFNYYFQKTKCNMRPFQNKLVLSTIVACDQNEEASLAGNLQATAIRSGVLVRRRVHPRYGLFC